MITNINDPVMNTYLPMVFQKLPIRDLGLIAQVCKEWKKVSSSDEAWKNIQLFDCPTPSPFKYFTVAAIYQRIPFFKYLSKFPQEELPDYEGYLVASALSEKETWERFKLHPDPKLDVTKFDDMYKVGVLLEVVVKAFDAYVDLSKIGFTDLSDAENLALKTKNTFHNSYPFLVLAKEYEKKGNIPKATEMRKFAAEFATHKTQ
jgi:hypothetical protein